MGPLEALAYQAEWAGKDTAHNLDFIPADKLEWKPAPTAKSVLQIANEMVYFAKGMLPVLSGGSFTRPEVTPATTAAEAKERLLATSSEYAQALRAVKPEDLGRQVDLGFGTVSLAQAAGMPVMEFVHHRGQIVYIQTLLGDTQDHFDMSAI
jgi:uncharacterized damage-inducible protein DinB